MPGPSDPERRPTASAPGQVTSTGFTLVETLLGLLLLSLVLLGAAPMFVYAMQHNAVGADFGRAGAIAVERLEWMRAQGYLSLTAGGDLTTNVAGYFDDSDPDFLARWQISAITVPRRSYLVSVRVVPQRIATGLRKPVTLTVLRSR